MESGQPTLQDYKDIMSQLEDKGSLDGREWKFYFWVDESGHSEFMDNFHKEMVNAVKNFDYEKFKKDNDEKETT